MLIRELVLKVNSFKDLVMPSHPLRSKSLKHVSCCLERALIVGKSLHTFELGTTKVELMRLTDARNDV